MFQTKLGINSTKFLKFFHDHLFSTLRRILMVKFLTFTDSMFIHLTQTVSLEFKPFRWWMIWVYSVKIPPRRVNLQMSLQWLNIQINLYTRSELDILVVFAKSCTFFCPATGCCISIIIIITIFHWKHVKYQHHCYQMSLIKGNRELI